MYFNVYDYQCSTKEWSKRIHIPIFTTRKRSLGQGNVFTRGCHSVRGGCLCMMSLPVWLPGPMFLSRGVSIQGVSVRGVFVQEGSLSRETLCQYSKERAVRILLECILVSFLDSVNYLTDSYFVFCSWMKTSECIRLIMTFKEYQILNTGMLLRFYFVVFKMVAIK